MTAIYTVKQVARILGYSTNSVYTFLKEKRIKGVRVGKGRFRIPQSELDRFLPRVAHASDAMVGGSILDNRHLLGCIHVGMLNIFDWFIGASAVIAGLGLFLFNQSLSRVGIASAHPVMSAIRTLLIGSGIGILLTNIIGNANRVWHKLFHVILGLLGLGMGIMFWTHGEIDGALTYGGLAVLVLLSAFISSIGGIAWFCLYISFLTVGTSLALVLARQNPHMLTLLSVLPLSQTAVVIMASVSGALFLFALWWGYARSKHLFWFTSWLAAFWYFAVAFWYAADAYWSRSFFFLVVGMTSLFVFPWEELVAVRSRRANLFTLGVFGIIMGVLLVGITSVYLMQSNVISTMEKENTYKVAYAKHEVETMIANVKATLESAADNSDFVSAVTNNDLESINRYERSMYETNTAIRRLVLLDDEGMGVNLYPFGTFDERDLSFRDYFTHARDTGKPYVSNLFEAKVDQSRRLVVTVAVPLYGKNHAFAGVLVGSLNLEALSARLQKIAVPERGEYILVVDAAGKRIMHPDAKLIGTDVSENHPVLLGSQGKRGVEAGNMYDGKRAVIAYDSVETSGVRWGVAILSPVSAMYQLTDRTNLSIFAVIIVSVILAGVILQGGFFYRRRGKSRRAS